MCRRPTFLLSVVVTISLALQYAAVAQNPLLVAPTDPLTAQEQQKLFHLPPGFEIQLVASEPEIHKPMNMAFDARGRLFATGSVEYPFPVREAGQIPRDTVRIFDGMGPEGKPKSVDIFADQLNIPIGIMPLDSSVLVYSIPNIWRITDTNGDGHGDKREVMFSKYGSRDTHGMTNSFTPWIDGWVYACHGYSNTSEVQGADGNPIVMNSGNTYRLRTDGSTIEYYTHGQVNPFGLGFDPLGNAYTADCHTMPLYMLLRGAYYPSFGKPDDGLGFGPKMIQHFHGSTGIAGVVYYSADHFPKEYQDTVFIGNPVTGRINHDRLASHGSTYEAIELPDFLSCDDPWFRPVDIQLAPDGSLYVADFYNRIIGHYEVPLTHPGRDRERGRIWRIVYKGIDKPTPAPKSPGDLTEKSLDELLALLNHANLLIRTQVTNYIVRHFGKEAVVSVRPLLEGRGTTFQRAHALWILERLGALDEAIVERLSADPERLVRVHLIKALAERNDWSQSRNSIVALVREKLYDPDPFVRRAAADALGRHPRADNVAALLRLWKLSPKDDTHIIHVARMALRDHLAFPGIYDEVERDFSDDTDARRRLAEVSLGVHDARSASYVLSQLTTGIIETNPVLVHYAARYCEASTVLQVSEHVHTLDRKDVPTSKQIAILSKFRQAMRERGEPLPVSLHNWSLRLARSLLSSQQQSEQAGGVEVTRRFGLKSLHPQLLLIAKSSAREELRTAAIEACKEIDAKGSLATLSDILLSGDESLVIRRKAAQALSSITGDEARESLGKALLIVPYSLGRTVAAGLAQEKSGAELLISLIEQGKASPRLLQEPTIADRMANSGVENIAKRMESLVANLTPPDQRLLDLIAKRRVGFEKITLNSTKGRELFVKNCALCHTLAGEGAKVGPELDGAGYRGLNRLMEDVLNPNANVDQTFRTITVVTTDGRLITGLKLREEGEVLVLANSEGKEVQIPLSEIEEQKESHLSLMPANVSEQLSEDDFYQLIGYLLNQRQKPLP